NHTAITDISTLSLHDALPIYHPPGYRHSHARDGISSAGSGHTADPPAAPPAPPENPEQNQQVTNSLQWLSPSAKADLSGWVRHRDRKSTRLNSSHVKISYAVF